MAVGFAPVEAIESYIGFVLIGAAAKVTRLQASAAKSSTSDLPHVRLYSRLWRRAV
jgi:hypothetical protein